MKAFMEEVLGVKNAVLKDAPENKAIRGIGMTEWAGYASLLSKKYSFLETYFHAEPRLDIMDPSTCSYRDLDFIICSEVLEHVLAPVSKAVRNLRQMLRLGGVLIFSVPFTDRESTLEHFPGLSDYSVCQIGDKWLVVNANQDGTYTVFDREIHFHGGPGTVLEMRLFARDDVIRLLAESDFSVKVLDEPDYECGYYWPQIEEREGAGKNLSHIIAATAV